MPSVGRQRFPIVVLLLLEENEEKKPVKNGDGKL